MNFKPLHDRVLIERIEEEVTQSGLVIPDSAKEKQSRGKVIAIGSGKVVDGQLVPLHIKVGDIAVFSQYGGSEIKLDGEEFVVVREDDILGIEA